MTTPDNLPNLPPPWNDLRRERIEKERLCMAKTRQLLATNNTARQEAIARFILATTNTAQQLQDAVKTRQLMASTGTLRPDFDRYLWEIEHQIRSSFEEIFGREMFPDPTLADVDSELRPMPAEHQAALLRAASHHANMTQPVPGWPVVITANAADAGYFATMRRNHPVKLGEIINGKRVIATHWHRSPAIGDQPVYRLEGEDGYRVASDIAGRIESISIGVDVTRPAAAESMTQPPADGGE